MTYLFAINLFKILTIFIPNFATHPKDINLSLVRVRVDLERANWSIQSEVNL